MKSVELQHVHLVSVINLSDFLVVILPEPVHQSMSKNILSFQSIAKLFEQKSNPSLSNEIEATTIIQGFL